MVNPTLTFYYLISRLTSYYQSGLVIGADIDDNLLFSHSTLSALRRIEGRVLLLPSIFHSLIRDIELLGAFNDTFRSEGTCFDYNYRVTQEVLQNYAAVAAAYSQNAEYLRDKIRGTAELLSDTLNLKHQKIAQSISENTLALTNAAVKDSATIRVITVVTLLYLPASFVAVSSSKSSAIHKTDDRRHCSACNSLEQTRQMGSRSPHPSCGSSLP